MLIKVNIYGEKPLPLHVSHLNLFFITGSMFRSTVRDSTDTKAGQHNEISRPSVARPASPKNDFIFTNLMVAFVPLFWLSRSP